MKSTILRECLVLARKRNTKRTDRCRHYSFLVQDNKIVEAGINHKSDSHFNWYPEYSGIHAECSVYKKAKGIMNHSRDFELVNIRLNKRGELRFSMPCAFCSRFLRLVGCKTVWFSDRNSSFSCLTV